MLWPGPPALEAVARRALPRPPPTRCPKHPHRPAGGAWKSAIRVKGEESARRARPTEQPLRQLSEQGLRGQRRGPSAEVSSGTSPGRPESARERPGGASAERPSAGRAGSTPLGPLGPDRGAGAASAQSGGHSLSWERMDLRSPGRGDPSAPGRPRPLAATGAQVRSARRDTDPPHAGRGAHLSTTSSWCRRGRSQESVAARPRGAGSWVADPGCGEGEGRRGRPAPPRRGARSARPAPARRALHLAAGLAYAVGADRETGQRPRRTPAPGLLPEPPGPVEALSSARDRVAARRARWFSEPGQGGAHR